jgi:hypothetical protein
MIKAKTISRTPYVSSNLVRSLEHWAVLHSMMEENMPMVFTYVDEEQNY